MFSSSSSSPSPSSGEASPFDCLELADLFGIAQWQDRINWQPYRDGIEIHRLYGDGVTGPTAVLLRFREAGTVPLHRHVGYEHILVLAGSQRDQNGEIQSGTLRVNPPDTRHSVISDAGCIVLAIYEKPVEFFVEDETPPNG